MIPDYDLNAGQGPYNFSTRLATEQGWFPSFAERAIIEYKKFMYLASISDEMVSPSPIVDEVWHLHLIFTEDYQAFCRLLGKEIHHIPSTHHAESAGRFARARQHTREIYQQYFGDWPTDIWEEDYMLDALHLPRAAMPVRKFALFALLACLLLFFPLKFILNPLLAQISGTDFLPWYIAMAVVASIGVWAWAENRLEKIERGFPDQSFLENLSPREIIVMQKGGITQLIIAHIDRLYCSGLIGIKNRKLTGIGAETADPFHAELLSILTANHGEPKTFEQLHGQALKLPSIQVLINAKRSLISYFEGSAAYQNIIKVFLAVNFFLLTLGIERLVRGLEHDKPVGFLVATICLIMVFQIPIYTALKDQFLASWLRRKKTEAVYYNGKVITDWDVYFLVEGRAALSPATLIFLPAMVSSVNRDGSIDYASGSCGSSGSSGCGSSCSGGCGGGCGGCGGD